MKPHLLLINDRSAILKCFTDVSLDYEFPYTCTCADNIKHATQIIDFLIPEVIFVDLDPNVGDALEFILMLRKNRRLNKIKIVAYSEKYLFYQCLSKGMGVDLCVEPPSTILKIYDSILALDLAPFPRGVAMNRVARSQMT